MENTYWNEEGKYQAEADRINDLMPSWGKTENKYMNLFLIASNIYYDIYNNGGGNIKDSLEEYVENYIKPFANEIKAINFNVTLNTIYRNLKKEEKLERFMDEVVELVSDKDLSYTKYVVYFDNNKEKLSFTEKEGFSEISFGEKDQYDSWIDHRVNVWNYEVV